MSSTLTFLGTGTSQGIPMIGCNCHVCQSSDSKDKRLRTSALIEHKGFKIVIDCGPDFRQQMLRENINDIDAVLLTHQHKDHTGGMDDIRAFNYFRQKRYEAARAAACSQANATLQQEKNHYGIPAGEANTNRTNSGVTNSVDALSEDIDFPIYAEERVQEGLKLEYHYAFKEFKYPGVPDFKLITIDENPFTITKTLPPGSVANSFQSPTGANAEFSNAGTSLAPNARIANASESQIAANARIADVYESQIAANAEFSNAYTSLTPNARIADASESQIAANARIAELEVIPIRVMHYKLPILGFRFDNLAYITDGSAIPESEFEKLQGLDVLIINTVRHAKHISHFSLQEAIDIIKRVGAKRNYLTHLSHQIGTHAELSAELAQWSHSNKLSAEQPQRHRANDFSTSDSNITVMPAYDGLKIEF